jgi:hypothetical protein
LAAAALMLAVGSDPPTSPSEPAEVATLPQAHSATVTVTASTADAVPVARLIGIYRSRLAGCWPPAAT